MKTVFFSSSPFTLPILEELLVNPKFELIGVVTQPDWEQRGKMYSNPIASYCNKNKIRLFQPFKLNKEVENFKLFFQDFDLGVVASYGQIINSEILNFPKKGMINWHPSLLPLYRGPTPLQFSIANGDKSGGLTWIKMDKGMDSGDIIKSYNLEYNNENFNELINKFGKLGAKTVEEVVTQYETAILTPQDHELATFTKLLTKTSGFVEYPQKTSSNDLFAIYNAYYTFPKLVIPTTRFGEVKILDMEIFDSNDLKIEEEDSDFYYYKGKMYLKCLDGVLKINEIQLSNGRKVKSTK